MIKRGWHPRSAPDECEGAVDYWSKDMAHLTLGLLGPMQVQSSGAPVTTLGSDKGRALLAFLAVEAAHPHRRESLVGLLWSDFPEQNARHNLRQTLLELRRAIEDHTANPPYLLITRGEIQFNPASDYTLDVTAFNHLISASETHPHDRIEICPTCIPRLEQAVALYRGAFLHEFFLKDSAEFEEWALVQREAMHQRALEALAHLADHYYTRGDYGAARRHAARQLELDPWREQAHRQLMRVLAAEGQTATALKQYETCRRVLTDEMGAEPSQETRDLYVQISRGQFSVRSDAVAAAPAPAVPTLPVQLTSFLGRPRELANLEQLISDPTRRLITLVGPGGIGKSRLALQAAENQRHAFAQGAALVPLALVRSTDEAVSAIAQAIGLSFYDSANPRALLQNYLRDKQMLLIMDGIEQLADGVRLFVDILQSAPRVHLLCTSREQLNLQGEWVFEVEGLDVPESDGDERLEEYASAALFLQRAKRVRSGFVLKPEERPALARICRLVGGMPLAIELAAAWMRTLSVSEIADEIERDLGFLTTSMRDLPERHRSMRAVFDHSWDMLTGEEQRLLARLAVFRGGLKREAAERVAGASLALLSALVIRSLVRRTPAGRYEQHELIRHYAAEQLRKNPEEEEAVEDRHSEYYLNYLQSREEALGSSRQKAALDDLTPEMDNLAKAWQRACQTRNLAQLRRTAWPLWYHYELRNLVPEATERYREAVASVQRIEAHSPEAEVAYGLLEGYHTMLAARQGRLESVVDPLRHGIELLRRHGDSAALADGLAVSALACWFEREFTLGAEYAREANALARTGTRPWTIAASAVLTGVADQELGNHAQAELELREGLALCRALGDARLISLAVGFLSRNARAQGHLAETESFLRLGLELATEINDRMAMALSLEQLALVAQSGGDMTEAERLSEKSIGLYREICDNWCLAHVLNQTGYLALEWGDLSQAARCFAEALQVARRADITPLLLDALTGIAHLQAKKGSTFLALELIINIVEHPGMTGDVQARAKRLCAELESGLVPDQVQNIRDQKALDAIIDLALDSTHATV